MLPRPLLFRSLAVASVVLAGGGRLAAQLSASSPFLPPANSGAAAPTQNAPIEFRGMIETPNGIQYRLADPTKKTGGGVWAKMNERNPELGVMVKQYNPGNETLVVDHSGRTLTLEMKKAKIISSGSAQAMVPSPNMVNPAANMLPAVTQTVVPNPSAADEQKRLEAVAQEVARRRALREQASTQLNPGMAPVAPVQTPLSGPQRSPGADTRQR